MKIPSENTLPKPGLFVDHRNMQPCQKCMSLMEALNNKKVKVGFRKFLESEFSVENLDFWLAVEDYKKVKDDRLRVSKAREIYDEHVSPVAPAQVNIDFRTQQEIKDRMSHNLSSDIFDSAQKSVFTIMENDSYARFVRSKYYEISNQTRRRSPRRILHDMLYNALPRSRSNSPSSGH